MPKHNIPSPNFTTWQARVDSTNEWQKILDQLLDRSGLWDDPEEHDGSGSGGPKEPKPTQKEEDPTHT